MTDTGYTIESLDTGLRLLLLFLEQDSVSVSQAAKELKVARSTAHRVLSTLQDRGMVSLPASRRRYVAGPALVEIARPRLVDPEARRWVRPVIEDAVRRTGETVHSVVLLGSQILVLDGRESEQAVRVGIRAGLVRPAYATSAGKLLLSRFNPDLISVLYPREELIRATPWTIATRSALMAELKKVAGFDHALSHQESEVGINAVAVLLAGTSWRDRIAIMASVPKERGSDKRLVEIAEELKQSAALLGPPPSNNH
jgi:IclR family transcriptional regulator, acetate operon repressor